MIKTIVAVAIALGLRPELTVFKPAKPMGLATRLKDLMV